jgi:hypothetical protein
MTADRSAQGTSLGPGTYAALTVHALAGYRGLRAGPAHPVAGAAYPAAAVDATGTYRATGVRQAIRAVALSRRGRVTYTLLFFRSSAAAARVYDAAIAEMVRSFRGQPPGYQAQR